MQLLIRSCLGLIAVFIGYGLGSEGGTCVITGVKLTIMGVALFLLVFFVRLYSFQLYKKFGKRVVLTIYFSILFVISIYLSFLKVFLCGNGVPFFIELFSFFGVVGVLGQPLPLPSPSNSPSDSSQARWEPFEEGVLLEGWPVTRDFGLEASIRSRISSLENSDCVFLLEKPKGDFWNDVKGGLAGCTTQEEYNQRVHFENRDLQVREQRHSCYVVWRQLLSEHPDLAGRAAYDPLESIRDFFNEQRDSIDRRYHLHLLEPQENSTNLVGPQDPFKKPSDVDMEEILSLQEVERDLRDRGVNSVYIGRLLGHSDS